MKNVPSVKLGIVAGSRDWLPLELAEEMRKKLLDAYRSVYGESEIYECPICITDNEISVKRAMRDIKKAECNAICIFYANYGPELSGAVFAKEFEGPVMFFAAAEMGEEPYLRNRRDSLCGFIDACYALDLYGASVYIPANPVGTIAQCVDMIREFLPIARTQIALRDLKIIAIGPRPSTFVGADAPSHLLYNLGISISEYSELELFDSYNKHDSDKRIDAAVSEMELELSERGNKFPEILRKLARYELTLGDWIRNHKGNKKFVALTSTCWPAFPSAFGFAPCYVNSRLTGDGIPVACEVDVYGAVSEYIAECVSNDAVAFLDVNNNVPRPVYETKIEGKQFDGKEYSIDDLFIGYHCGVTCSSKLVSCSMECHFINEQLIGEEKSKGTIQGQIKPGPVTMFRLQGGRDGKLRAYIAQGQILPVSVDTYGGFGIIAIPEFGRFLRNVVIEKHFPNHTAIAFGHYGKELTAVMRQLGIGEVDYNHPKDVPYPCENQFASRPDWF